MTMTLRYAIIGNPVAHSKSPEIHTAFAAQTGIDLRYDRLLAPRDGFHATIEAFRADGGRGANVTLPFKLDAFAYVTEMSNRARDAGAVNTLMFDMARVFGDNTDGVGLVKDVRDNLNCAIAGKRVLIAGAGGAARGVIGPLLAEGPAVIAVSNRTASKADDIVRLFRSAGNIIAILPANLSKHQFDVVINATAASLDNDLPAIPRSVFAEGSLAYDMMYGKGLTPFLALGRQAGASVADGLGMLVEQAAESFMIWHGIRPHTDAVFRHLRLSAPLN